jgi:hypothetical protein
MEWHSIDTPPSKDLYAVLLYNPELDFEDFAGHCVIVSNTAYARVNAARDGYTMWSAIDLPEPPK